MVYMEFILKSAVRTVQRHKLINILIIALEVCRFMCKRKICLKDGRIV